LLFFYGISFSKKKGPLPKTLARWSKTRSQNHGGWYKTKTTHGGACATTTRCTYTIYTNRRQLARFGTRPCHSNLLIRKVPADCFATEIHLEDFIPASNWQQAGILLMEDTGFRKRSIRFSIAYNDYFGGYQRPKEIILQGINSGGGDRDRPEEIAHIPLFTISDSAEDIVINNLEHAALRIEKNGNHYRFLYYASNLKNAAFKEAFTKEINIQPKYIAYSPCRDM
jgi:hypothetical protein